MHIGVINSYDFQEKNSLNEDIKHTFLLKFTVFFLHQTYTAIIIVVLYLFHNCFCLSNLKFAIISVIIYKYLKYNFLEKCCVSISFPIKINVVIIIIL